MASCHSCTNKPETTEKGPQCEQSESESRIVLVSKAGNRSKQQWFSGIESYGPIAGIETTCCGSVGKAFTVNCKGRIDPSDFGCISLLGHSVHNKIVKDWILRSAV